jgi:transposase-like protein
MCAASFLRRCISSKAKNVPAAKAAPQGGDVWTWTALDSDSKLIVSYLIGGRDGEYAMAFMDDLRSRLANRVQLTTDGHKAYLNVVDEAFGIDVDYAQLVKLYGEAPEAEKRYSPQRASAPARTRSLATPTAIM